MRNGRLRRAGAVWLFSIAIRLSGVRASALDRERHAGWVGEGALAARGTRWASPNSLP